MAKGSAPPPLRLKSNHAREIQWTLKESFPWKEICLIITLILAFCLVCFVIVAIVFVNGQIEFAKNGPKQGPTTQNKPSPPSTRSPPSSAAEGPKVPSAAEPKKDYRIAQHPSPDPLQYFSAEHNNELLWGSYLPHLYFGMRTRAARAVSFGLMWFHHNSQSPLSNIRHDCNQNDGIKQYGWLRHDGRTFGHQQIREHLDWTTGFVKYPGAKGGDWSARIHALPSASATGKGARFNTSVVLYLTLEDGQLNTRGLRKGVVQGSTAETGAFSLVFPAIADKRASFQSQPINSVHRVKDSIQQFLSLNKGTLTNKTHDGANMAAFHYFLDAYQSEISLDVVFISHAAHGGSVNVQQALTIAAQMTGEGFDNEKRTRITAFESRFAKTFPISNTTFGEKANKLRTESMTDFAMAALSNTLGGMGYWHGQSVVQHPLDRQQQLQYFERPLFSCTPSRSFFPRGFLWDEGFHQLLIGTWDPEISKDVIAHWMGLVNVNGWIPREQILDDAARGKVPSEFIPQHMDVANPPSLLLSIDKLIARGQASAKYLDLITPRLKSWLGWLNSTQQGQQPNSYYWRGRNFKPDQLNALTLSSGLDDYPRALQPSLDERHVDLHSWMLLVHRVLAKALRGHPGQQSYESAAEVLLKSLNEYHWNEAKQTYQDWGSSADAELVLQQRQRQDGQTEEFEVVRRKGDLKRGFIDHIGVLSVFPFLLDVLPHDSPHLGALLKILSADADLWSPFGIRSLAPSSSHYGKGNDRHSKPYWRGAVWLNLNFLTLRALHNVKQSDGPSRAQAEGMYSNLRDNVVGNLVRQYRQSGYLWEQYSDVSGKGSHSHPFTGWSALVVLMMAEIY
eukprot:TRINITY_DN14994_c0_g1_i1.p1 TRINITY_DN14994_c0_g1~~TRINITY_DN14994_c0_g1_i1.p1  ORF type:complete len:869 (+),score=164.20 TRINITY_DN14994_c0_g1_i1:65-2608(+)